MKRLPHWVLTDTFPAFYDSESLTATQQTARVYGAMQELIDSYNKFVDEINGHIDEHENTLESDLCEFKSKIIHTMENYIQFIDTKMNLQDVEIAKLTEILPKIEELQQELDQLVIGVEHNDLVNHTRGWINLAEYPKNEGESDDSARISRAISELKEGGSLLISGENLEISEPIVVTTKNVKLFALDKCTITAITEMEACIKFTASNEESINIGVSLENISFNANNMASYGLLIHDTVGLYVSEARIINCIFKNALIDGVHIAGSAWLIYLDGCKSLFNVRDGLRMVTTGSSAQNNANTVVNSVFSNNYNNGISVNGLSHIFSSNDIEQNNCYGIYLNPTDLDSSESPTIAHNIVIQNNYIELNKQAQIYAKSTKSAFISGLSIKDNYLWSNVECDKQALVVFDGVLEGITELNFSDNVCTIDGAKVTKVIEGNNILGTSNYLGLVAEISKYSNIGYAKIDYAQYQIYSVPPALIQNNEYQLTQISTNVLEQEQETQKIVFGLPVNISYRLIRSMNVYVETDSTNYTIRCRATVKNLKNGSTVQATHDDVSKTANALISFNLLNNWLYERRTHEHYVYFEFIVQSANGTYLNFHIPYLELTR